MRILVVDNYDSFTYNLVHALAAAAPEATIDVRRNDAVDRAHIAAANYDGIVLSPGPGHPGNDRDFGVCKDLITHPIRRPDGGIVPMLGICLGMQGMAHHTGGDVVLAPECIHGEADAFAAADHPMFAAATGPLAVGRYHSLCVDPATLPTVWTPLGTTGDGTLMAMAHTQHPWIGLQFHPESILTPDGPAMVAAFLALCTP